MGHSCFCFLLLIRSSWNLETNKTQNCYFFPEEIGKPFLFCNVFFFSHSSVHIMKDVQVDENYLSPSLQNVHLYFSCSAFTYKEFIHFVWFCIMCFPTIWSYFDHFHVNVVMGDKLHTSKQFLFRNVELEMKLCSEARNAMEMKSINGFLLT